MATVANVLKDAEGLLKAAGIDSPRRDARVLLGHVLQWPTQTVSMRMDIFLMPDQESVFKALVDKRAERQPISQIVGKRGFWTLDLAVTQDTLDPRPDSEVLIETLLDHGPDDRNQPMRILDFGTGTGCLLLAVLSEFPAAFGVGVDISPQALLVARSNAACCSLAERARFLLSRWGDALDGMSFDIIIANPPYIPDGEIDGLEPEVSRWEPRLALAGGPDGLDCYRQIMPYVSNLLTPGGLMVFEVGQGQALDVARFGGDSGLTLLEIRKDLGGVERCVCFRLGHA